MSAYTDAMNMNINEKLEKTALRKIRPQPNAYIMNQNKWIILLICLILIIIYSWTFFMLFSLMKNVHSKHDYFDEYLNKETDQSNTIKKKLFELQEEARNNLRTDDLICHRCWFRIYNLDYNSMSSYILKNNKQIKKSYDDTLHPLHYLLTSVYYLNTMSMATIFKIPLRLFFLSSLFAIVNLCIEAELFIANAPNVYYALVIGICIFLLTIYLLFKMVITLLTVIHYQIMKNILTSE